MVTNSNDAANAELQAIYSKMRALAEQVSVIKGESCALVLIEASGEGYEDVHPELLLEDACARNGEFPEGFTFMLLNAGA